MGHAGCNCRISCTDSSYVIFLLYYQGISDPQTPGLFKQEEKKAIFFCIMVPGLSALAYCYRNYIDPFSCSAKKSLIMKSFISAIIIFSLSALSTFAQNDSAPLINHTSFQLNAGTMAFGNNQSAAGIFFLNPTVRQPLTERLSVHAGAVYSSGQLFQISNSNTYKPFSSLTLYAAGSFQVNEQWTLYGGAMHGKPLSLSNAEFTTSASTVLFGGFDYHLNEKNTIGIRLLYSKEPYLLFFSPSGLHSSDTGFSGGSENIFFGW